MSIRGLTATRDWQWGQGKNNYLTGEKEIALNLETRVMSFLGDCFWATDEGIDWFNLLDYNQQDRLEYAVQEVITNTPGVTGVNSVDAVLDAKRRLSIHYSINTIYTQNFEGEVATPTGSVSGGSTPLPTPTPAPTPAPTPTVTMQALIGCSSNYKDGDIITEPLTITANDGYYFGNSTYHYLVGDYFYSYDVTPTELSIKNMPQHSMTVLTITANKYDIK